MPRKPISFELDFMIKDIFPRFTVKQFDDVSFNIKPKNQGLDYDTTGMTGKIFVGVNDDMFMQTTGITVSSNNINVLLDKNMLQKNGRAYAEIELTDSAGTITSSSFIFDIDPKIGEGGQIPGEYEGFVEKYERLISEFKSQVNTTINNCNNKVNTTINNCNTNVDNKLNTVDGLINTKITSFEKRFNTLTASQQQDTEVIDARDGETSLKARLDRDIEKAKEIYVDVEGNYISTDSSEGYLKNIEILGNTVQDAEDLADIRSVGDKVEGQELYEIGVVSYGKNLFDKTKYVKGVIGANGVISTNNEWNVSDFIKVRPDMQLVKTTLADMCAFDINKNPIGIIANGTTIFTIPANCYYIRCNVDNVSLDTYQLEEGTVATQYEPYQEDKLTILSPTQLEKVGDVRDRIICKDGVWGVEKNVGNITLDITKDWRFLSSNSTIWYPAKHDAKIWSQSIKSVACKIDFDSANNIVVAKDGLSSLEEYKNIMPIYVKYQLAQPQFIPLPHDQQVKLRTFAGQTNIHFETEIEGTIKAQVPKSIGASINTHTEQIANLNNELARVKKLEESTVSTVETESNFTTVEETFNGYFEDVKLEGKTLVNRFIAGTNNDNGVAITQQNNNKTIKGVCTVLLGDMSKKIIVDICSIDGDKWLRSVANVEGVSTIINNIKIELGDNEYVKVIYGKYSDGWTSSNVDNFKKILILEGDHTQNPPSYFEGLKSVGQSATTSEEDVNEISVKSLDTTEDTKYHNDVYFGTSVVQYSFNPVITKNKYVYNNSDKPIEMSLYVNNSWSKDIPIKPYECTFVECPTNGSFNVIRFTKQNGWELTAQDINNIVLISDYPIKVDKKRLLYYNPTTQAWEKPILREWDSIEKHSDGKYYYHKRSGEVVLNGSEVLNVEMYNDGENYLQFNIMFDKHKLDSYFAICDRLPNVEFTNQYDFECFSMHNQGLIIVKLLKSKPSTQDVAGFKAWLQANPITLVYQLAQEEVYECTNIDLITYEGETNYIVNAGAISPKSILKVHSNISNVVKILQEKVSLLENNVKASQEVQDMMILESDMRILDMELALMEYMPANLSLGGDIMFRSATYFNFLKNHIKNETYEKEYLENVMNKYLATNRLTQEEYDELYKLLYPPVYDIELPIEY